MDFTLNEEQQTSLNQTREKFNVPAIPLDTSVSGLEPSGNFEGINKSKPNDQLNESTNQNTPARPDTITNPNELNLSEVQSDMTPNLGLRDGSLLAMALPFKGKENKKQEDTKVTISKENNAIQRMETNFKTIYKLAKEVGVKFP